MGLIIDILVFFVIKELVVKNKVFCVLGVIIKLLVGIFILMYFDNFFVIYFFIFLLFLYFVYVWIFFLLKFLIKSFKELGNGLCVFIFLCEKFIFLFKIFLFFKFNFIFFCNNFCFGVFLILSFLNFFLIIFI